MKTKAFRRPLAGRITTIVATMVPSTPWLNNGSHNNNKHPALFNWCGMFFNDYPHVPDRWPEKPESS
jgi:hypothetical protein